VASGRGQNLGWVGFDVDGHGSRRRRGGVGGGAVCWGRRRRVTGGAWTSQTNHGPFQVGKFGVCDVAQCAGHAMNAVPELCDVHLHRSEFATNVQSKRVPHRVEVAINFLLDDIINHVVQAVPSNQSSQDVQNPIEAT
jgi:hypothetical protein